MKKRSEATQTARAGCSKADPQTNKHTNRQGRSQSLRSLARSVINKMSQKVTRVPNCRGSSVQTVLSLVVSWMSGATARWLQPAECSTHGPRPRERCGHRRWTDVSRGRPVRTSTTNAGDAESRGRPRTGDGWRGTTGPGHWDNGRQKLQTCTQSAVSSSANAAAPGEAASHGRTPPGVDQSCGGVQHGLQPIGWVYRKTSECGAAVIEPDFSGARQQ